MVSRAVKRMIERLALFLVLVFVIVLIMLVLFGRISGMEEVPLQLHPEQFPLPLPALAGAAGSLLLAMLIIWVSKQFDTTRGLLTISVMILVAFITATFASMIYQVPQVPSTEILIGALATSVGAIIAYWMSGKHRNGGQE